MEGGGHCLLEILSRHPAARRQTTASDDASIAARPRLWRRLFHMVSGSAIPVVAIFTSSEVMVVLLASLSGLAVVTELGRFALPQLNRHFVRLMSPLLKQSERQAVTGATYLVLASLAAFLLFDKPVAITALLFLSLGDPVAALVGSRVRGPRLFGKSPLGSLAFTVTALAIAAVLMAADVVDHHWAIGVGAAIAAIVELMPLHLDDNVTVPLISGGAMALMMG